MRTIFAAAILVMSAVEVATAQIVPTTFVYQGELQSAGVPLTGPVDIVFTLCSNAGGTPVVGTTRQCVAGLTPTNGRFAVELNFGQNFPGADRFVEIQVRPAASGGCATAGGYTLLLPRQQVRATPTT
jgi:hypothetical protein